MSKMERRTSEYASKLDPDFSSQFSQGVEKNLRNLDNLTKLSTMPYSLYRASQIQDPKRKEAYLNSLKWSNDPLWVNPDYTPEEAANASALGVLSPLMYPTNLVTGAITGDMDAALQGQRSKPLFTDYRQPEYASVMSGIYEAGYDPLNAVGIGIMEKVPVGRMTSELTAKQIRNFNQFLAEKRVSFTNQSLEHLMLMPVLRRERGRTETRARVASSRAALPRAPLRSASRAAGRALGARAPRRSARGPRP